MNDSSSMPFVTHYRVLYGDTDAGGVVYNANYLRLFEIGRTELMRTHVCWQWYRSLAIPYLWFTSIIRQMAKLD